MNKVYVLQKDLPDAKAGTELIHDVGDKYMYIATNGNTDWLNGKYVRSYPEWFLPKKEEKPKEWEVTKSLDFDIVEVKRLSDGEVFTIGDELCELGVYGNQSHPIKSIEIINGTIAFNYGHTGSIIISAAKKAKPQSPVDTDAFVWTDELVHEYLREMVIGKLGFESNHMDKFKQSKTTPKEDTVNVSRIYYVGEQDGKLHYHLHVNKQIPEEKYEAIKKAIDFVLNDSPVFDKEKINSRLKRIHYLQALGCDLISRIYHYGNFKAETRNERLLESVLNELQLYPTTENDILRGEINFSSFLC